jgi:hypothetical protein
VDLRVAAAEPVLLVLVRFAFPRLVADFRVALRLEAAADRLPPAERFALARLVLLSCAAAFVVPERFLRLRGFWVLPVMASVMLDTPSVIVSRMEVPFPSFSFSILKAHFDRKRRRQITCKRYSRTMTTIGTPSSHKMIGIACSSTKIVFVNCQGTEVFLYGVQRSQVANSNSEQTPLQTVERCH